MKTLFLLLAAFFPLAGWAACETELTPADKTIGDVKRKIKCLADENAGLRKQLEPFKGASAPLVSNPVIAVTSLAANFSKRSDCLNWIATTAKSAGYTNVAPMTRVVYADALYVSIVFLCLDARPVEVILTSTRDEGIESTRDALRQALDAEWKKQNP